MQLPAKKLGFGCMRLPLLNREQQDSFDYEKANQLVDSFLKEGFTYFDTAYVYHGYHGEEGLRHILVDRHPRDAYTIATKLPLRDVQSYEDMERIFQQQLDNCGVTYFDYYLLHNMGHNVYQKICDIDGFNFVKRMQAEGKIKYVGMSFHDTPELLEEILANHKGLDFIQLQINYMDWESPTIQSRKCLEIANRYHLPIVVMEPCKGGSLANVSKESEAILKAYHSDATAASWALRYAASQKGVFMVLSGMNEMSHVLDNTESMKDFVKLNEEEYKVLDLVRKQIEEQTPIACTTCRYCVKGCPKQIAIPDYFSLYNDAFAATSSNFSSQGVYYNNLTLHHGKASDCIGCRQCENACPQHLPIIKHLEEVAKFFEQPSSITSSKK